MAITAEFTADFSDFVDGAKQAEGALNKLEATSKQTAKGTNDSFSAMSSVARDVAGALGLAFSVSAAVNFAKEIVATASALEKMHAQTGITVEDLQRMSIVGDSVGVSLDTMTGAALKLQASLGKGDAGVTRALADLGIEIETFKRLDAAAQLAAVATAVQSIEDPLRRAADLQALYGKGWAELFPALKAGFDAAGTSATVMSSRTVEALDRAGNAASEFYRVSKVYLGEALAQILGSGTKEYRDLASEVDRATAAAARMHPEGLLPAQAGLIDAADAAALLNAGLKDQVATVDASIATNKQLAESLRAVQQIEDHRYATGGGLLGLSLEQQKASQARFEAEVRGIKAIEDAEKTAARTIVTVTTSALDEMFGKAQSVLQATTAEATAAVSSMQQYSMVGGQQLTQAQWDEYYKTSAGIADIIRNNGKRYYATDQGPVLRASGGPVTGGSPYVVGERGPELFVPHTSGTIVPGGGGVHITINGSVLGNKEEIARVVGDAVLSSYRTGGARLPV